MFRSWDSMFRISPKVSFLSCKTYTLAIMGAVPYNVMAQAQFGGYGRVLDVMEEEMLRD